MSSLALESNPSLTKITFCWGQSKRQMACLAARYTILALEFIV